MDSNFRWSPLSTYGQVLVCLLRHPDMRQEEVSRRILLDLRSVSRVIADLRRAGVLRVEKDRGRNVYAVVLDAPLPGPLLEGLTVGDLLAGINSPGQKAGPSAVRAPAS